ncbi:uncharacterized protein RCC_08696 [Ramularia collo-cygni]|uniref:Uncharacterized protein n=1 Tax=Ramularia collo-cygni TaxID=112498 RepID=A0A2D3VMV5_9PEZI|nr:uncharacterized protein RCC_08696 [Ramularia collo-cygni]CZT22988.1 uncharacterized protein RCC_08696 [Ramularia collo-cygni]
MSSTRDFVMVFSDKKIEKFKAAWPEKDVLFHVGRYADALIKFHREFPATDPIPPDKLGTCHTANNVWLVEGAVEEAPDGHLNPKDGNYVRAYIEKMNWFLFTMIAENEPPSDFMFTFEDLATWEWQNTTDNATGEELHVLWEALMNDSRDHIKEQNPQPPHGRS